MMDVKHEKYLTWINFRVDLFSRMATLKKFACIYFREWAYHKNFAWINFREGRITNRKRKQKKLYCKPFLYNVDSLSTQHIYIFLTPLVTYPKHADYFFIKNSRIMKFEKFRVD